MSEYFVNLTPYQYVPNFNPNQIYTFHIQNKYEKSLNRWNELSTWLENETETNNLLLLAEVASQFGHETTAVMLSNPRRPTRLPLLTNSARFID